MLFIRADANSQIGTGHIMRCLSIAGEFERHGEEVVFIVADEESRMFVADRSHYKVIILYSVWDQLDGEIDGLINCIKQFDIRKLLIDTYFVTKEYLRVLSLYTKTIYLDDLAEFDYPVHMLINYNIYSKMKNYIEVYQSSSARLLLGCDYVPLRREFVDIVPVFREDIKNILITTGGTDNYNIAGNLLNFLTTKYSSEKFNYHVIVGKYNDNQIQLERLSKDNANIILHYGVTNMAELMLESDVAITAGGSTMYELCACGVPMITYSIADNQIDGVLEFDRIGIARYCGDIREKGNKLYQKIYKTIIGYQKDYQHRKRIYEKMTALVDGKGASRLYSEMDGL